MSDSRIELAGAIVAAFDVPAELVVDPDDVEAVTTVATRLLSRAPGIDAGGPGEG